MESINEKYINIVIYKPSRRSSYIELPSELRNSAKGLINLQKIMNALDDVIFDI